MSPDEAKRIVVAHKQCVAALQELRNAAAFSQVEWRRHLASAQDALVNGRVDSLLVDAKRIVG